MFFTFCALITAMLAYFVIFDASRISSLLFSTIPATVTSFAIFTNFLVIFFLSIGFIKFDTATVYQPILMTSFLAGCMSIHWYMTGLTGTKRVIASLLINALLLIFLFAFVYAQSEQFNESMDFKAAIYFSIVTWTTLGYGDYQPLGVIREVAAVQAIMGYIFMGFLVGSLANRR